jgi:PAS domain S-box-containing protein
VLGAILTASDGAGLGVMVTSRPHGESDAVAIVWVSDAACTILGRSREELMRGSPLLSIAEEEIPHLRERLARRSAGETIEPRFETVIVRPDGTRVPIAVAVTYAEIDGKRSAISLFEDISARRRAVSELAASEARFRALVEAAPDGIAIVRAETLVYANPFLVKMMGYDHASEMVGKTIVELLDGDEMGSRRRRYRCVSCCLWYERDGSGLIYEVDA